MGDGRGQRAEGGVARVRVGGDCGEDALEEVQQALCGRDQVPLYSTAPMAGNIGRDGALASAVVSRIEGIPAGHQDSLF